MPHDSLPPDDAPRLRVAVASRNPVKLAAARRAFVATFGGPEPEIVPTDAASGVAGQPVSDAETRRGALNRARAARAGAPGADYWLGIEGGVEAIDGECFTFAWMAVLDSAGRLGCARTATLQLPPAVRARLARGEELGPANDAVFGTSGSKERGGAFGLLTDGRYTREGVYAEALCLALVPFVNPLYAESQPG